MRVRSVVLPSLSAVIIGMTMMMPGLSAGEAPPAPPSAAELLSKGGPPPRQAVIAPEPVSINRTVPAEVSEQRAGAPLEGCPTVELTQWRVFEEPLLPVGSEPTDADNRAVHRALTAFIGRAHADDWSALTAFIAAHPQSPWRVAVEINLGIIYRQHGYLTRAADVWRSAWSGGRAVTDRRAQALLGRAVGELASLLDAVGDQDGATAFLSEIADFPLSGAPAAKVTQVRANLVVMREMPAQANRCGPLALNQVLGRLNPDLRESPQVVTYPGSERGTNLHELALLAGDLGVKLVAARRSEQAEWIAPAIIHGRLGHFSALLAIEGDRAVIIDQGIDGSFQNTHVIPLAALAEESSGIALLPAGAALPLGWASVTEDEAADTWGRCGSIQPNPDDFGDCGDPKGGGTQDCGTCGMPAYSVHLSMANLNVKDTPIGYAPPKGPAISFTATYNSNDTFQPAVFTTSNLGHGWTHDWFSYVQDSPTQVSGTIPIQIYLPGGGIERGSFYVPPSDPNPPPPNQYGVVVYKAVAIGVKSKAAFERLTNSSGVVTGYIRRLPDGTELLFGRSDGATANPRRFYLSKVTDPTGNVVVLGYDTQERLRSITDAIGQVTVIAYENAADPLKITKITDPFGRTAHFAYDETGRLQAITDVIAMTSTFAYQSTGSVMASMTTPYGTTAFDVGNSGFIRWVEATDPMGAKERIELRWGAPGVADTDPVDEVPTGMPVAPFNSGLSIGTFFWDKKAMRMHPGDCTKARQYVWVLKGGLTTSMVRCFKAPFERRVWFTYPGQTNSSSDGGVTTNSPASVARVLPDGTTQLSLIDHSPTTGAMTRTVDPLGRETRYLYDAVGINLTAIEQKDGDGWVRVATIGYGLSFPWEGTTGGRKQPTQIRDASGQLQTISYTSWGALASVTNPLGQSVSFAYNGQGYLQTLTDPGGQTTFTYDAYGRVRTVADHEGDTVTYDYDIFDRPTQMTYADGSTEQIAYNRLDAEWWRDRLGRWTRVMHNARRQVVAVQDSQNRIYGMQWCLCGDMKQLWDPAGRLTMWTHDAQGRLTSKIYPDGSRVSHEYDVMGRLASTTDAKNQITQFSYTRDDRLSSVQYLNAQVPTPGVNFSYDAIYGRVQSTSDGEGVTQYDYLPITANNPPESSYTIGAGRLASIDGPWDNDTITFSYDALGRPLSQSINGVASTVAYDTLGRVSGVTNALGTFGYTYEGNTGRVASLIYPNAQQTTFSYAGGAGLRRLQSINNRQSATGPNLSTFTYGYDATGRITSWSRQFDSTSATTYSFGYDRADQLVSAVLKDGTGAILETHGYAYDAAGSRILRHQGSLGATGAVRELVNQLNQLTGEQGAGAIAIAGNTDEPAIVTVDGQPAQTDSANQFTGTATVAPGSNTITVQATDGSGNTTTRQYVFNNASGAGRSFTYDVNGNLLTDGTRTFTWDAADRLVAIAWDQGGLERRTEFSYNGQSQRIRTREWLGVQVLSTVSHLWLGSVIAEDRNASGAAVVRRYFGLGEQEGGVSRFYTFDHLGSIREVTDMTGTVLARYDYDPYGTRTRIGGSDTAYVCTLGYTGHVHHGPSGLVLTWFRAYDPTTSRWLNRDPIGEEGGVNLYAYVNGDPINFTDPLGLWSWRDVLGFVPVVGSLLDAYDAAKCGNWGRALLNLGLAAMDATGGGAIIKGLTVGTMKYGSRAAIKAVHQSTRNWNSMRGRLQRIGEVTRNPAGTLKRNQMTTDHILFKQRGNWPHSVLNHPANLQTNVPQWLNSTFEGMNPLQRAMHAPTWMKLGAGGVGSYGAGLAIGSGCPCE